MWQAYICDQYNLSLSLSLYMCVHMHAPLT